MKVIRWIADKTLLVITAVAVLVITFVLTTKE